MVSLLCGAVGDILLWKNESRSFLSLNSVSLWEQLQDTPFYQGSTQRSVRKRSYFNWNTFNWMKTSQQDQLWPPQGSVSTELLCSAFWIVRGSSFSEVHPPCYNIFLCASLELWGGIWASLNSRTAQGSSGLGALTTFQFQGRKFSLPEAFPWFLLDYSLYLPRACMLLLNTDRKVAFHSGLWGWINCILRPVCKAFWSLWDARSCVLFWMSVCW